MSFGDSDSPYQSPKQFSEPAAMTSVSKSGPKKPAGFLAVSIITMIMGGFGVLASCCGIGSLFGMNALSGLMDAGMEDIEKRAADDGDEKVLREIEAAKVPFDVQADYMGVSIVAQAVGMIVSFLMVVGGIMGLTSSPLSKITVLIALIACIPSRIFNVALQLVISGATVTAQQEIFDKGGDAAGVEQVELQAMIGNAIGVVISVVVVIGYCAMIAYLLLSKGVKEYFGHQRGETTATY